MRVLRHVHSLCRPGATVLDLTSVPPPAAVEAAGDVVGHLDQRVFLARAAVTELAVDRFVADGRLAELASIRFPVLKHFDSETEAISDMDARPVSRLPAELRDRLAEVTAPVVERSWSLLRALRVQ